MPLPVFSQATAAPRVTFGQLLGTPAMEKEENTAAKEKAEKIRKFLQLIEENGRKSLTDFQNRSGYKNTPDDEISFSDNIASFVISPVPTLHPELAKIISGTDLHMGQPNVLPIKSTYTISLLGDSMTDTLGKELTHLKILLKEAYPQTDFYLMNYGQGATDIENGLFRLTNRTQYEGWNYPPLVAYKPDIVVVESFAYNHWGAELSDLNRQWLAIARIIDTLRSYSPDTQIILASTISPNAEIFGDGILNWPKNLKWDGAITTKAYLQNLINFATSQGYPLADAYTASLNADGQGEIKYINPVDHLHPSEEGKMLYAQKIAETIKKYNMIPVAPR